ncbi:MAG: hypothetical protein LBU35_01440 [Holosporales bacterium]|jgi:hypothetical protein|nr:hypothetical protein [Holosporales bacterium]
MKFMKVTTVVTVMLSINCNVIGRGVEEEVGYQLGQKVEQSRRTGVSWVRPGYVINGVTADDSIANISKEISSEARKMFGERRVEEIIPEERYLTGEYYNLLLTRYIARDVLTRSLDLTTIQSQIDSIVNGAAIALNQAYGAQHSRANLNTQRLDQAKRDMKLWCPAVGFFDVIHFIKDDANRENLIRNDLEATDQYGNELMNNPEELERVMEEIRRDREEHNGLQEQEHLDHEVDAELIFQLYREVERIPRIKEAVRQAFIDSMFQVFRRGGRRFDDFTPAPPSRNWDEVEQIMLERVYSNLGIYRGTYLFDGDDVTDNEIFQEYDIGKIARNIKDCFNSYLPDESVDCLSKEIAERATKDYRDALSGIIKGYLAAKHFGVLEHFIQNSQFFLPPISQLRDWCTDSVYFPEIEAIINCKAQRLPDLDAAREIANRAAAEASRFDFRQPRAFDAKNFAVKSYLQIKLAQIYLILQTAGAIRSEANLYELLNRPVNTLYQEIAAVNNETLYNTFRRNGEFNLSNLNVDHGYPAQGRILQEAVDTSFRNSLQTFLTHYGRRTIFNIPEDDREDFRQYGEYYEVGEEDRILVKQHVSIFPFEIDTQD